jgi:Tol biopolymer transport system component
VRSDGSKRRLGPYDDATWSPMGLFVAAVHRDDLVAMTPTGRVRWTLRRPEVQAPRWSPSGYRVAYTATGDVRVVAGDGTGDRRVGAGYSPEWAPGRRHVLAYADPVGGVHVVDTDARRELWRVRGGVVRGLSWSPDGRRLAAAGRRGVRVLDVRGRLIRRVPGRASAVAFSPSGRDLAIVRGGATGELVVNGKTVFAGAGALGRPVWSPDGRWLLLSWPRGHQWLFVHPARRPRVVVAPGLPGEFGPAARGEPSPASWCCSR